MAYEGVLANAAVTAIASAGFLYVAAETRRRRVPREKRAMVSVLFFGIVGVHLAGAALRQVVAFVGAGDPAFVRAEWILFHVVVIPATLSIVPLAYIAAWALTGREVVARAATAALLLVSCVGIASVYVDGIVGPDLSFWASEWAIGSRSAKIGLGIITLTAFVAGAVLLRAGRGPPSEAGRRARLLGWSCIIYYAAFVGDALGEPGLWLLIERVAMAVAAFVGYQACFPSRSARAAEDAAGHVG